MGIVNVYFEKEDKSRKGMSNCLVKHLVNNRGKTVVICGSNAQVFLVRNSLDKYDIYGLINGRVSFSSLEDFVGNYDSRLSEFDNFIFYRYSDLEKSYVKLLAEKISEYSMKKVIIIDSLNGNLDEFEHMRYRVFMYEGFKFAKCSKEIREEMFYKKFNPYFAVANEKIIPTVNEYVGEADEVLFINCPWADEEVFKNYERAIIDAVERGVVVTIGHGYVEGDDRYEVSERLFDELKKKKLKGFSNFNYVRTNSHFVVIISEKKVYLHSSNNIFSSCLYTSNELMNVAGKGKDIKEIIWDLLKITI